MTQPVLELSAVSKDYRGLRPLRIEQLTVAAGDRVAIIGLDQTATEVFVNLVTGATLPDRGEVRLFGRPTTAIGDSAAWLAVVDRFGIVSERAVLLEALSVIQNLALPFTLEIEPPAADVRDRAVALAHEVGLPESSLARPIAELGPAARVRVRFARSLALDPTIVVLEHPTAGVPRADVSELARHVGAVARQRTAAVVALTGDRQFAEALPSRVLTLDAGTGRFSDARAGWLSRFRA